MISGEEKNALEKAVTEMGDREFGIVSNLTIGAYHDVVAKANIWCQELYPYLADLRSAALIMSKEQLRRRRSVQ